MAVVIGLGVTGSISAYKSAEILRAFQKRSYDVLPIMTRAATHFIAPLTLQSLSRHRVLLEQFDLSDENAVAHIRVTDDMSLLLVAPATANIIAKFAAGIADDFLTCVYLAARCPVVIAPAMNSNMYAHAATQANIQVLKGRGVRFVDPESGYLACGWEGAGRLADPERIVEFCENILRTPRSLAGHTVLVTAGPTREPLDPVRFLSNRSSGRMGYAVAAEAFARGATVILVSGPVSLPAPAGVEIVRVETAEEMQQAVMSRIDAATIVIKAAAVSDFRPTEALRSKIKKGGGVPAVQLERTPDILAGIGKHKGSRILVGFSAETTPDQDEARRKMREKNCDLMVLNDVSKEGAGFDSENNEVWIIDRGGDASHVPLQPKAAVAARILDACEKRLASNGKS